MTRLTAVLALASLLLVGCAARPPRPPPLTAEGCTALTGQYSGSFEHARCMIDQWPSGGRGGNLVWAVPVYIVN